MVEMSLPSTIDRLYAVSTVKLPMRGSHTAQMGWQLNHAFEKQKLDLAVLAVDAYSLMGPPQDMEEIYEYLWNDNLLDDVYYLLNRDVVLVKIPKILKNRKKSLEGKRDNMYQWTDIVFSEKSVLDTVIFEKQREMIPADTRLERSTENIEKHLLPQIKEHPETHFLLYMPPYSAAYWFLMQRGGLIEQQMRSRLRLCELCLEYDNVEIYDFSSRTEWICNLDEYFDYSHHSTKISNELFEAMARGENRVNSLTDLFEGNARIKESVDWFANRYEPKGEEF